MVEFQAVSSISDSTFAPLKGKAALVTGGCSGIGLATVQLLLANGVRVAVIDTRPPKPELAGDVVKKAEGDGDFVFVQGSVTNWSELRGAFNETVKKFGTIDLVHANAGIGSQTGEFMDDEFDEDGQLQEPGHGVIQVNLIGVKNTVKLAMYHMKKSGKGGSIVLTSSASAYGGFPMIDYVTSKTGVIGLARTVSTLGPKMGIRVNTVAPSWTVTGLVPEFFLDKLGAKSQPASDVARQVALLFADPERNGQVLFSHIGKYCELDEDVLSVSKKVFVEAEGTDAEMLRPEKLFEAAEAVKNMRKAGSEAQARPE